MFQWTLIIIILAVQSWWSYFFESKEASVTMDEGTVQPSRKVFLDMVQTPSLIFRTRYGSLQMTSIGPWNYADCVLLCIKIRLICLGIDLAEDYKEPIIAQLEASDLWVPLSDSSDVCYVNCMQPLLASVAAWTICLFQLSWSFHRTKSILYRLETWTPQSLWLQPVALALRPQPEEGASLSSILRLGARWRNLEQSLPWSTRLILPPLTRRPGRPSTPLTDGLMH